MDREMDDERVCSMCGDSIEEDAEFFELDDGSIVCESCYEFDTEECGLCGGRYPKDDMEFFGDDIGISGNGFRAAGEERVSIVSRLSG